MGEAQLRKHVRVPGTDEHVHFQEVPGLLEGTEKQATDPLKRLFGHRILGAREKHE